MPSAASSDARADDTALRQRVEALLRSHGTRQVAMCGFASDYCVDATVRSGYAHGFDLELIGPRIDAEGRLQSARRACDVVGAILNRLGA